jgi:hypothetical protein
MDIRDLLSDKKSDIIRRWHDLILDTYPPETATLLKGQKDGFVNPVVQILAQGIEDIFSEIVNGPDPGKTAASLDGIIRIRAVQDFTPADAIGFLFILKRVIREELLPEISRHGLFEDMLVIESAIDDVAGIAFDVFMRCREQIYDLKANEMRNWTYRLLKRAQMVKEVPAE